MYREDFDPSEMMAGLMLLGMVGNIARTFLQESPQKRKEKLAGRLIERAEWEKLETPAIVDSLVYGAGILIERAKELDQRDLLVAMEVIRRLLRAIEDRIVKA